MKIILIFHNALIKWITLDRLKIYPPHIPLIFIVIYSSSIFFGQGMVDSFGKVIGNDFVAFYNSGRFLHENRIQELYNFEAQYIFQTNLFPGVKTFTPYVNPPFVSFFNSIFSYSNYLISLLAWLSWIVAVHYLSIVIYLFEYKNILKTSSMKLFLGTFCFFPVVSWISYCQNSSFSLLLYICSFIALRNKHDFISGILVGFLFYKFQLMIPFLILFFINFRIRAIAGVFSTVIILLLINLHFLPGTITEYINLLPTISKIIRSKEIFNYPTWGLQSFFGFSSLLLDNISTFMADSLYFLLCFSSLIFLWFFWRKTSWEPKTIKWDFAAAATLGLGLLVAPHGFLYDFMILLLPFGIIWPYYYNNLKNGIILDNGKLLFWSAMVYIGSFLGSYFSMFQLQLTKHLGLPSLAIQVNTLFIFGWVYSIFDKSKTKNDFTLHEMIHKKPSLSNQ